MFLSKLRLLVKRPSPYFLSSFHTQNLVSHPQISPSLPLLAGKCTSLNQLKQIHAQMIVSDQKFDGSVASRIISSCVELDDLGYSLELFYKTHELNSIVCDTIIRAQANGSNPVEAILLYMKMRKLGVTPGNNTFTFVLKACTDCHLLNSGKQIHAHVIKFGLDLDLYVINSLIRYYGACGHMSDARKLFEKVPVRNFIIWTMIVNGYARNFFSNEALLLFDQMLAKGVEPNGETLLPVLCACARSLSSVSEDQTEVGLMLGTALVDIYAKKGEISVARSLFNKIPERNTTTWNAVICGLTDLGHAVEALELFQEMGKSEVLPNDITFTGVLSACCRAGLLEDGRDIFLSMKRVYENEPKIEHYRCMVDLLVQGGRLVEAEELISGMVCEADIVVLGALLEACRNHGNIAIAERVVKKMLHLEPQNHGVYDVLSSMYADAGRWEDELKLRKEMKDLTKIPGWGFVDTWMELARKHIL
ncbi:hypothetical protein MKX03_015168 [Papaver bracteatum]|nr:hypothetical protein MKX03_015168 [Papaver bracteatum]